MRSMRGVMPASGLRLHIVAFDLVRQYDSLEAGTAGAFGWGWGLSGSDIRIETDVPLSGREHLGVYEAFDEGARLWLTLPGGERAEGGDRNATPPTQAHRTSQQQPVQPDAFDDDIPF
jgi:hypothetical protein